MKTPQVKYDMNLQRFMWSRKVEDEDIYEGVDRQGLHTGELRLGRYLATLEELKASFIGKDLVYTKDSMVPFGKIVDIIGLQGYWVVSARGDVRANGNIDIIRGQNAVRPVQ